jgi:hypothetical protein
MWEAGGRLNPAHCSPVEGEGGRKMYVLLEEKGRERERERERQRQGGERAVWGEKELHGKSSTNDPFSHLSSLGIF